MGNAAQDSKPRLAFGVVPADPGHAQAGVLHQQAADLAKQRFARRGARNCLVDLAQPGIQPRDPRQLGLVAHGRGCGADDVRGADHAAIAIANSGNCYRNANDPPIAGAAAGLDGLDPISPAQLLDEGVFARDRLGGDQPGNRPAEHRFRGVSEERGGGRIPAGNAAGKVQSDDGVHGRLDDRRKPLAVAGCDNARREGEYVTGFTISPGEIRGGRLAAHPGSPASWPPILARVR